ncbi:MAG TPA: hypothetical protein VM266_08525 [Solirubrobacteraceae bacterium]|nr:hypothetical protein [Solirubrobacteraceae bacterium]
MTQQRLALATLAGAAAWLVQAVNQVMHPTFAFTELTRPEHYVNDGSFAAALVLTAAGFLLLRRERQAPPRATAAAIGGQLLVAIGVLAGLVTGTVPGWFAAVGVPGNLVAFVATVVLAVWAWRTRALPRPAALALGLVVPVALVGGDAGGAILPAALWGYVGARALTPAPVRPTAAAAS